MSPPSLPAEEGAFNNMPTGIYKRTTNKGWFKKGFTPWFKGRHHSEEEKIKAVATRRKNGSYKISEKTREKMRIANRRPCLETTKTKLSEARKEDKGSNWKGDKVKYRALHIWVEKHLGKPCYCQNINCKYPKKGWRGILLKPKRYEWANKKHTYKRNLTDWIRLCKSCHIKYDKWRG